MNYLNYKNNMNFKDSFLNNLRQFASIIQVIYTVSLTYGFYKIEWARILILKTSEVVLHEYGPLFFPLFFLSLFITAIYSYKK